MPWRVLLWVVALLWAVIIFWQSAKVFAVVANVLTESRYDRDSGMPRRLIAVPALALAVMIWLSLVFSDFMGSLWLRVSLVALTVLAGLLWGYGVARRASRQQRDTR